MVQQTGAVSHEAGFTHSGTISEPESSDSDEEREMSRSAAVAAIRTPRAAGATGEADGSPQETVPIRPNEHIVSAKGAPCKQLFLSLTARMPVSGTSAIVEKQFPTILTMGQPYHCWMQSS